MLRKLSQTFVVVMLFASCWLTILHHKNGPQLIGLCVGMVLAGNVAWLVSKVFEKRFVEIWARPRPFV